MDYDYRSRSSSPRNRSKSPKGPTLSLHLSSSRYYDDERDRRSEGECSRSSSGDRFCNDRKRSRSRSSRRRSKSTYPVSTSRHVYYDGDRQRSDCEFYRSSYDDHTKHLTSRSPEDRSGPRRRSSCSSNRERSSSDYYNQEYRDVAWLGHDECSRKGQKRSRSRSPRGRSNSHQGSSSCPSNPELWNYDYYRHDKSYRSDSEYSRTSRDDRSREGRRKRSRSRSSRDDSNSRQRSRRPANPDTSSYDYYGQEKTDRQVEYVSNDDGNSTDKQRPLLALASLYEDSECENKSGTLSTSGLFSSCDNLSVTTENSGDGGERKVSGTADSVGESAKHFSDPGNFRPDESVQQPDVLPSHTVVTSIIETLLDRTFKASTFAARTGDDGKFEKMGAHITRRVSRVCCLDHEESVAVSLKMMKAIRVAFPSFDRLKEKYLRAVNREIRNSNNNNNDGRKRETDSRNETTTLLDLRQYLHSKLYERVVHKEDYRFSELVDLIVSFFDHYH